MSPRSFLDLADELAVGDGEAEWRSAVSRAYYAAFHVGRDFLIRCGFEAPRADQVHAYLILRLMNSGNAQLAHSARDLADLRSRRNYADYDLNGDFPQRLASTLVFKAADAVRVFEDYIAEPSAIATVAAAILAYERDVLRQVTWRDPAGS